MIHPTIFLQVSPRVSSLCWASTPRVTRHVRPWEGMCLVDEDVRAENSLMDRSLPPAPLVGSAVRALSDRHGAVQLPGSGQSPRVPDRQPPRERDDGAGARRHVCVPHLPQLLRQRWHVSGRSQGAKRRPPRLARSYRHRSPLEVPLGLERQRRLLQRW